ncbi:MAG: hypothetical protein ACRCT8_15875 [Lacipirellulaceae bacterium]
MIRHRLLWVAALAAAAALPARADVVLDWNSYARDAMRGNLSFHNPGMTTRTMAMMNLAIYDSLKMTSPTGSMFYDYGQGNATPGYTSSGKAAAIEAAYTVLSSIYTEQSATFTAHRAAGLAAITDGVAKTEGLALGAMIGSAIVAHRAGDGHNVNGPYVPSGLPGGWSPDPLNPAQQVWGPNWGAVTPFALDSNTQFLPPAPPTLNSPEYAASYNEVKSLGAKNSLTRTADQTEIGVFWAYDRPGTGSPPLLYNQILETLAVQQGNTEKQNAELFAKASVAMADASVVSWNSKFEYDLWRPITGIRGGDADGNAATSGDATWEPLGAPGGTHPNGGLIADFTPPFPAYVSGHATFGAAAMEVLANFYGTDNLSFTLTSDELPGVTRDFTSFSQAIAENGRSRIYLGIHWDFDDFAGRDLGRSIADYLFEEPFISGVVVIPEPGSMLLVVAPLALARRRRPA